jgi:hypothetical protein
VIRLPRQIDSAGLEITHTGAPGAIVAHAVSLDRTANMCFDLLLKDPDALPSNRFSFPWRLDGPTRSLVQIKNTRSEVGWVWLKLVHEAGEWEWGIQEVQPGETVTLDIRQVRDQMLVDVNGEAVPRWVERGQAQWSDLSPHRGLIGRVAIYDPQAKINTSTNEIGPPTETTNGCISFEPTPDPPPSSPCTPLGGPQTAQTQTMTLNVPTDVMLYRKQVECGSGEWVNDVNISTVSFPTLELTVVPASAAIVEQVDDRTTTPPTQVIRVTPLQVTSFQVQATYHTGLVYPYCIVGDDYELLATLPVTVTTQSSSITVLTPNGGEQWPIGTVQPIQWSSLNVSGNVKIELSRNRGISFETVTSSTANTGSFDWPVTGPTTSQALIKITSVTNAAVRDTSNAYFTISPASSMTVLAPNGGEDWPTESAQTIQWSSVNVSGNVRIEVSRDGGSTFETVIGSTANTGSYSWTVTGPATSQAVIKITSVTNAAVSDTSNGTFIIRQAPTGPPTIIDISPGLVTTPIPPLDVLRMGFVSEGATTRLTITGSNLNQASLFVPPSQQAMCAPTMTPVLADPSGRALADPSGTTLQVDVTVPLNPCLVVSQYINSNYIPADVQNAFGDAPIYLSLVPARLKVTAYTPATVRPGSIYAVSVVGYHLGGATLTSDDPSRLQIANVMIRSIEDSPLPLFVMNAVGQVAEGATGQVNLTVSGPMGTETEPVTIDPNVPVDVPTSADGVQTITVSQDVAPPIYFQTPTVLIEDPDQPTSPSQGGTTFGARFDPFHFQWFSSLIACRGTACPVLSNFPLTPVTIAGLVVGVKVDISLDINIQVYPASTGLGVDFSASICVGVSGWAGVMGGPAVAFSAGICAGSPPSISASQIIGMGFDSTGCLEMSNLFQDPGVLNGTVRASGCCPGTLEMTFTSFTSPDGGLFSPSSEEVSIAPWDITLTSAAPQITRVEFASSSVQVEPGGASVPVGFVAYVKIPGTGTGGQNVTVHVSRDTLQSSPVCITSTTPTDLTQFVPADGQEHSFLFSIAVGASSGCPLPGQLAETADLSLDGGLNLFACPVSATDRTAFLNVSAQQQKTVKITTTVFNPTTTNPGGSSTLTVTLETQNITSQDFLQVRVDLDLLQSSGCGLYTTLGPGQQNPQGRLGNSGGTVDFPFMISVPANCGVPAGNATWKADVVNLPSGVTELPPVQDTATLTIQPGQQATWIKPRVISLAIGQTKQLTPEDQTCQPMQQFPPGTTFGVQNSNIATVSTTGLLTARATGITDVQATLPNNQPLNCAHQGCVIGPPPRVQVGPMTIKLRFLNDAVLYLRDTADGGLGLGQTKVDQIKTRTRDRVQELFDQALANVTVELAQGSVTVADDDAVMVVDITAIRDANNRFLRAPDQNPNRNPQPSYVLGRAGINHLNLNFGGDIIYNASIPEDQREGVFVNRLPYYKNGLLVVNEAQPIGNGIGNVAAHEAGHRLGLVPNPASRPDQNRGSSEKTRDQIRDDRFTGWAFDGTDKNHTREAPNADEVMAWATFDPNLSNDPYVFTTTPKFRPGTYKDIEYLRAILPRP